MDEDPTLTNLQFAIVRALERPLPSFRPDHTPLTLEARDVAYLPRRAPISRRAPVSISAVKPLSAEEQAMTRKALATRVP